MATTRLLRLSQAIQENRLNGLEVPAALPSLSWCQAHSSPSQEDTAISANPGSVRYGTLGRPSHPESGYSPRVRLKQKTSQVGARSSAGRALLSPVRPRGLGAGQGWMECSSPCSPTINSAVSARGGDRPRYAAAQGGQICPRGNGPRPSYEPRRNGYGASLIDYPGHTRYYRGLPASKFWKATNSTLSSGMRWASGPSRSDFT